MNAVWIIYLSSLLYLHICNGQLPFEDDSPQAAEPAALEEADDGGSSDFQIQPAQTAPVPIYVLPDTPVAPTASSQQPNISPSNSQSPSSPSSLNTVPTITRQVPQTQSLQYPVNIPGTIPQSNPTSSYSSVPSISSDLLYLFSPQQQQYLLQLLYPGYNQLYFPFPRVSSSTLQPSLLQPKYSGQQWKQNLLNQGLSLPSTSFTCPSFNQLSLSGFQFSAVPFQSPLPVTYSQPPPAVVDPLGPLGPKGFGDTVPVPLFVPNQNDAMPATGNQIQAFKNYLKQVVEDGATKSSISQSSATTKKK